MYCPTCLGKNLELRARGTAHIMINGKSRDSGRFLFNREKEAQQEILNNLKIKLEDFFRWYAGFQNIDPIKNINIYSPDFHCENNCRIPGTSKISTIGVLFSQQELDSILDQLSKKYTIPIELLN